MWKSANEYAQFGRFWTTGETNRSSWVGVYADYFGRDLHFADDEMYDVIVDTEEFQNMPDFPDADSIKTINGVIVVKVANPDI